VSESSIVLVGGGHSHVIALSRLAKTLKNGQLFGKNLILVSESSYSAYSGMLPGVIAGHYRPEQANINLARFCERLGISFIAAKALSLDADKQQLTLNNGRSLEYSMLSINTGATINSDEIAGSNEYGTPVKPINSLLDKVDSFAKSLDKHDRRTIAVVGAGIAGIEVIFALAHRFREYPALHYKLITASSSILPEHNNKVRNQIMQRLAAYNIAVITQSKVDAVEHSSLRSANHTYENNDFIIWCNGVTGQDWLNNSNIALSAQGFVKVNTCLQSTSHPFVFASGDCSHFHTYHTNGLPKSGVYAVRAGPIIARNILNTIKDIPLTPFKPQKEFLRLISTGPKHAIATKGSLSFSGDWVWRWKNVIDNRFVNQFR